MQGVGKRREVCLTVVRQQTRSFGDQRRRHQRFVALDIDDNRIGAPTGLPGNLVRTIGAGLVGGIGHRHHSAEAPAENRHLIGVGGDGHARRTTGARRFPDPLHHRLATEIEQHLARQARGAEARGDDDVEAHSVAASSSLSVRASSSSITGTPSRIG